MTTIYYFSTIIFIVMEWLWLVSPIEKTKDNKRYSELLKEFKGKKWDEFSTEYKSQFYSRLWHVWVLFWFFIGLFTFQWLAFLGMLIFNILVISPLSRLTRYSIVYTVIHWLNSLIKLVFGLFVIINHYHLKIDLTQWLFTLIN